MKRIFASLFLLSFCFNGISQEKLDYFLPVDVTYNKNIPTPEDYFGMQVGQWHLTYDQILNYLKEIDRVSDRAMLAEYGRTYENRPLVHLIFTAPGNNLEELKKKHNEFIFSGSESNASEVPLVINLGYGVHGNESSASNSSVLTVYYLAAAQGEKIDNLLKNAIILVDPCLNPDGLTRHSTWANMNQSITDMGKTDSRQFSEMWPGGRGNHYWFDLNRDYLLLVHPESRGRVEKFHEWKPNVVTDHHEMEANSSFFFQPGVHKRNNPLTPEKNYTLTSEIAKYHAKYLDKIGSQYFSEEQFDDYYFGKGSSYPDINGGIGILFEQAGFRGRIRETASGVRKLAFGIRNQFTVTLSTLDAAMNLKNQLLDYQKEFYNEALQLADKEPIKAYVFGSENDPYKTRSFIDLLNRHQILVYPLEKEFEKDGQSFKPGSSYAVLLKQPQYRLIKSLFEITTSFADTTFYDVSTWTMPYAFDIPFVKVGSVKDISYGNKNVISQTIAGKIIGGRSNLAYLFRWNEYLSPASLFAIQNAGLKAKVATEPFSMNIDGSDESFNYGTIIIPVNDQPLNTDQISTLISEIAASAGIDFFAVQTGQTSKGSDLGSNNMVQVKKPEVLMLAGTGADSREAGEIWHMFDQKYHIPVCLTEINSMNSINLNKYNVLILPGGNLAISGEASVKIKNWVQQGGTLIACGNAINWTAKNELSKLKMKKEIGPDTTQQLVYAERRRENDLNTVSGAIFMAKMDITHPLCYGYQKNEIPVFKTENTVIEKLNQKFAEPVCFTGNPYISGFVSDNNLERIKNSPVISVEKAGTGNVISIHESLAFRGIWQATNKLFMNAVFFGDVIR